MTSSSRPLLLGHRGARAKFLRLDLPWSKLPRENSLAAFDYALASGCDGFEFDVRFTSDRRSALCHDPKFGRREVATTEYSGLERRRRFERRHAPIACLEEVLARFAATAYLDIEIKVGNHEEEIVAALKAQPPTRGLVVSSFLPDVLLRLHDLDDSLFLGYVCKHPEALPRWTKLPIAVCIPHFTLVTRALVKEVHDAGSTLITWTVNRQRDMVRLAEYGVDGLISDDPALLRRTFLSLG